MSQLVKGPQPTTSTPTAAARRVGTRRRGLLGGALAMTMGGLLHPRAGQAEVRRRNIKLGFDNFAVRGFGWKADALIDYAAKLSVDSLFITDLDAFESYEPQYLGKLRARAAEHGIQIQLGTWSICPSSNTFKDKWGTAEEHLALAIRVASALGSQVVRVVLGNFEDRKSPGGIKARIADTVKVLRKLRPVARKAGVKIAMENHAGDMQATEVVELIEKAGKDFVGANMDSGNAVWAMEDPLRNLEILGPYALTTSLRDSILWPSANGATVQWTAMGDGLVDWAAYFDRFEKLCPGVPVHIETISGVNRELPYLRDEHWQLYPDMRAADFARFVSLVHKGAARGQPPARTTPAGQDRREAEKQFQQQQIERSLEHCKRVLGLGLR